MPITGQLVIDERWVLDNMSVVSHRLSVGSNNQASIEISGYFKAIPAVPKTKALKEREAFVQFDSSSRVYLYKTMLPDLRPGDYVLVDSKNGLGLATFMDYRVGKPDKSDNWYSWILEKVDLKLLKMLLKEQQG